MSIRDGLKQGAHSQVCAHVLIHSTPEPVAGQVATLYEAVCVARNKQISAFSARWRQTIDYLIVVTLARKVEGRMCMQIVSAVHGPDGSLREPGG